MKNVVTMLAAAEKKYFLDLENWGPILLMPLVIGEVSEARPLPGDPIFQLGVLCGIDGLAMNAEGYCCLLFNERERVHLMRCPSGKEIYLSIELIGSRQGEKAPLFAQYGNATAWSNAMARLFSKRRARLCALGVELHREGSEVRLLRGTRRECLQRIVEIVATDAEHLLAEIDLLLLHARRWQRVAGTPDVRLLPHGSIQGRVKRSGRLI